MDTIAATRKYEVPRLRAAEVVSVFDMRKDFRIPAELSDWIKRSGREVVLLKERAGVTHDGSLNSLVRMAPKSIEKRV